MNELTYTVYPDGIEYTSFGGHVRSREYVENWPFVEDDGKKEVFALDGLPYGVQAVFGERLRLRGCRTSADASKHLGQPDEHQLILDLAPDALLHCNSMGDLQRLLRICAGLDIGIGLLLEMAEDALR